MRQKMPQELFFFLQNVQTKARQAKHMYREAVFYVFLLKHADVLYSCPEILICVLFET